MNNNIGEYVMGFSKFHLVQVPVKHTLNTTGELIVMMGLNGLGVLKRISGTWGAYVGVDSTRRARLRGVVEGRSCGEILR